MSNTTDSQELRAAARAAILQRITQLVGNVPPEGVKQLAEAYAFATGSQAKG